MDPPEFVHGDMVWIGKIVLGKQRLSSNVPALDHMFDCHVFTS